MRAKADRLNTACLVLLAGALAAGCPGPARDLGNGAQGPGGDATVRGVELELVIAHRPVGDDALDRRVWRLTDEGVLPPEERSRLEANGVRVALAGSSPPATIARWIRREGEPQFRGWHGAFALGTAKRIALGQQRRARTFLLSDPVRGVHGEQFDEAICQLAVAARAASEGSLRITVTPTVEHGRQRRRLVTDAVSGSMQYRYARQEHPFARLSFSVTVQPGQILMVGTTGSASRSSLGGQMFIEESEHGREQKLVLIRVTPIAAGGSVEPPGR